MPEMTFVVRWPDGSTDACYSPSLVVRDHLEVGETYAIGDFVSRATFALGVASERVREIYGTPCLLALDQSARIVARAERFARDPSALVVVEAFE